MFHYGVEPMAGERQTVGERQTCHADRTYVGVFIERRGMEKGGGETGLWRQKQLKRREQWSVLSL